MKPKASIADEIKRYLSAEISTGKLLELVSCPQDLVGGFALIIDEERANGRRIRFAVEQTLAALSDLQKRIEQLRAAIMVEAMEYIPDRYGVGPNMPADAMLEARKQPGAPVTKRP